MKEFSDVTGKSWEAEDAVRYVNPHQVAWMMNKGCELLDVFPDNEKLIFTIKKNDHKRWFPLWMERKTND